MFKNLFKQKKSDVPSAPPAYSELIKVDNIYIENEKRIIAENKRRKNRVERNAILKKCILKNDTLLFLRHVNPEDDLNFQISSDCTSFNYVVSHRMETLIYYYVNSEKLTLNCSSDIPIFQNILCAYYKGPIYNSILARPDFDAKAILESSLLNISNNKLNMNVIKDLIDHQSFDTEIEQGKRFLSRICRYYLRKGVSHPLCIKYIIDLLFQKYRGQILDEKLIISDTMDAKTLGTDIYNHALYNGYESLKFNYFNLIKEIVFDLEDIDDRKFYMMKKLILFLSKSKNVKFINHMSFAFKHNDIVLIKIFKKMGHRIDGYLFSNMIIKTLPPNYAEILSLYKFSSDYAYSIILRTIVLLLKTSTTLYGRVQADAPNEFNNMLQILKCKKNALVTIYCNCIKYDLKGCVKSSNGTYSKSDQVVIDGDLKKFKSDNISVNISRLCSAIYNGHTDLAEYMCNTYELTYSFLAQIEIDLMYHMNRCENDKYLFTYVRENNLEIPNDERYQRTVNYIVNKFKTGI